MCGLSVPPAIEKPKPDVPRSNGISSCCQLSSPLTYSHDMTHTRTHTKKKTFHIKVKLGIISLCSFNGGFILWILNGKLPLDMLQCNAKKIYSVLFIQHTKYTQQKTSKTILVE